MLTTELAELFERDLTRLAQELRAFPDTATLWKAAPGVSNPAGNLALHLEGNLREFVGRQLGGVAYARQRPKEFGDSGLTAEELAGRIEETRDVVGATLRGMAPAALDQTYPEEVLGKPLTSRQFLIHLAGHLNYHLGQIDYLRRVLTGAGAIPLAGL